MKVIPYKVIKGASFVIRVNEYNTPDEYTNEYIGIQNPPEGHWHGSVYERRNKGVLRMI